MQKNVYEHLQTLSPIWSTQYPLMQLYSGHSHFMVKSVGPLYGRERLTLRGLPEN